MGAKQSKRSVDISGKEAESAGEVAAAGAGGEGRVEALADADALKPQANGAAHIHEQTDKEKQLDSGTPENEKDATTEKEAKEEVTNEEVVPVTNGDTGDKPDDGDSAPAPEDTKKPKKEKVKKKWSLRSISFSRKDKPKQEKKHKEEEPKTNGEPEKVPEEAAEVTAENATKEVAEEFKPEAVKEEKTPETPVTEPLTNGSSTPESPKVESPAADEPPAAAPAPTPAPETDRPELKAEVQPEQLPVNGLSLEEQKPDAPEAQNEESKPEEPATDTTETAPAPEIPVKKEVCVEQMSLESTPPPLPANPPPSSVASFAATTMAPELTDASLANTAELVISTPPTPTAGESTLDAVAPSLLVSAEISDNNIATAATELPPPLKESSDGKPAEIDTGSVEPQIDETIHAQTIESQLEIPEVQEIEPEVQNIEPEVQKIETEVQKLEPEVQKIEPDVQKVETEVHTLEPEVEKAEPEIEQAEKIETLPVENVEPKTEEVEKEIENAEPPLAIKMEPIVESETDAGDSNIEKVEKCKSSPMTAAGDISPCPESNVDTFKTISEEIIPQDGAVVEECSIAMKLESPEVEMPPAPIPDDLEIPELSAGLPETNEDLPPPPPIEEEVPAVETFFEEKTVTVEDNAHETKVNSNHILENTEIKLLNTENLNGNVDTEQENLKNKTKDSLGNVIKTVECNGNSSEESRRGEAMDVSPSEPGQPAPAAAAAPPPAADMPQEPIPVSDKLADLIPEVPVVPELNTQTETSSDVAVAN